MARGVSGRGVSRRGVRLRGVREVWLLGPALGRGLGLGAWLLELAELLLELILTKVAVLELLGIEEGAVPVEAPVALLELL